MDLTSLPPYLRATKRGAHDLLHVEGSRASATISLHGAHVLDWAPKGTSPVLFLSPDAQFASHKAIRGGIPICWPWFNAHPSETSFPSHGFARIGNWECQEVTDSPDGPHLRFQLLREEQDRSWFPFDAQLTLEVTVGDSLQLSLTTANLGDEPFPISQALHTYFHVDDISQTNVLGLESAPFLDTVPDPPKECSASGQPITIEEEVDRIYQVEEGSVLRLIEKTRTITLSSRNSQSAVVWNPWIERSQSLADLPDQAYLRFLCVETANVGRDQRTLTPGESTSLELRIGIEEA
ncbi:MAG: D-hexose-6-phosphate mutarotase [Verrucomicrobiota bacterium]